MPTWRIEIKPAAEKRYLKLDKPTRRRMLSVLMGLQAGLPPLDFSGIKGQEREVYFRAVRSGLDREYRPMQQVFEKVIARTLRGAGKRSVSATRASR